MQTTTTITVTGDNDDCIRRFDHSNVNWVENDEANEQFLREVAIHMRNLVYARGYLFLNDFLDALRMDRIPMGQILGWRDSSTTVPKLVDIERYGDFFILKFKPHGIIINDII